jgi:glutathione peroxidase
MERNMTSVYDFKVETAAGDEIALSEYAGKVLLIVNVASKCGLTPQYEGLEALYRAERDNGLQVVGFPCNQFLEQEPGSNDEIQDFCKTTYDVTFPIFARVEVNGPDAHPLFEFLRGEAPGDWGPHLGEFFEAISGLKPDAAPGDVRWNFTKFLVDADGNVVKRYESPVTPAEIGDDIRQYLDA